MKQFQVLNKLGEGAFSIVYKVKRISDNLEYALKKVSSLPNTHFSIGQTWPACTKRKRNGRK